MRAREERLRELLRDADPAREVVGLSAGEVAAMRRSVLGAVQAEPRSWLARPALTFAVGAGVAAVAVGVVVLWLASALREPSASGARMTAASTDRARLREDAPRPSTAWPAAPTGEAAPAVAPTPVRSTSAPGTIANMSASHSRSSAARRRGTSDSRGTSVSRLASTNAHARAARRSAPASIAASIAAPRGAPSPAPSIAPAEIVAAAGPESEPRPYQIQLIAPGGTRIVWLLTAPSGR